MFDLVALDDELARADARAGDTGLDRPALDDAARRPARRASARTLGEPPSSTVAKRNVYQRSDDLKVYVLRRADGTCEGCEQPAPFLTTAGRPYLEPHHTRRLSDGGPDDYHHVIALCPTCHRRVITARTVEPTTRTSSPDLRHACSRRYAASFRTVASPSSSGAELVVHAGDMADLATLERLRAIGPPVVAVRGNVDDRALASVLPDVEQVVIAGWTIGVIHDAGPSRGRLERMRRRFPSAAAVVFGHSHVPLHETASDGFQIFNPGSPTVRRRQPRHTMGVAHIREGDLVRTRHARLTA